MKELNRFLSVVLVLCMLFSMVPFSAFASLTMGTKPADGTTTGNPFPQGTGGSNSFRIPAMVTLNDGTIVAAADARWNTTYDGGGLDTIVSYSKDNGASWNYTFANYLGDNGNTYNGSSSTAFIDPALATDGDTVYMLCDLYPYGVALNGSGNTSPSTSVGFNDDGTLKLAENGTSGYTYYLKDGQICKSNGDVISGYTVDAYFNVYQNGTYVSNLFFSDSPYQVVRTGYLYLTKSTDGGKTWSDPMLLNLKTSSEQVCLVGPGRGLVTYVNNQQTIIFPVYSYNGSSDSQRMGFIYSTNGGSSWTRVDSSINWSSESAVVELGDGTLRFFYRNGNSKLYYVDYSWTNGWGTAENTGIATNSNTQISAISLQGTVDGKQVILVSCPTGSNNAGSADSSANARLNGRIQIGLVDSENYTMTWKTPIDVTTNNSQFMYSCLTALTDSEGNETGKIAILYENKESAWGTGDNCYYTMAYKTYDLSTYVTFDVEENTDIFVDSDENTGVSVTVDSDSVDSYNDWSMTVTVAASVEAVTTNHKAFEIIIKNSDNETYTGSATVTLPVGDLNISKGLYGFVVNSDGSITKASDGELSEDGTTFTFTAPHFSIVGLAENEIKTENIDLTVDQIVEITVDSGNYEDSYTGEGLNESIAKVEVTGETTTIPGGTTTTPVSDLVNGNYIIGNGSQWLTLTNGTLGTTDAAANATEWTITASGSGYTIQSGSYYLGWNSYSNTNNWGATTYTYTLAVVTSAASWSYDSATGFYSYLPYYKVYNIYYQNHYLSYSNSEWTILRSATSYGKAYTRTTEVGGTTEKTTIKITGISAGNSTDKVGTTSVVVGETLYNITVNRKTQTVSLAVDGTATYIDASTTAPVVGDSTVVSATLSNGTLTIKGLKDGATTITTATTVYTVTVAARGGAQDAFTIAVSEDRTISVELNDGEYVEWSVAGASIAGVAGVLNTEDNTYGADGMVVGRTEGVTTVTGTVKNAAGEVVAVYTWEVTVTAKTTSGTGTRTVYVNIDLIEHCTVYYSINGGELIKVNGTGIVVDKTINAPDLFNIMLFAAPDEGYALTYIGFLYKAGNTPGSSSQFYTLSNGNPDGTGSDAWPFVEADYSGNVPTSGGDTAWKSGHGFRWSLIEGNMSINQMKVLFSNAIALGCDGVTTITVNNTNNGTYNYSNFYFVAQKLPTITKEISKINGNTYSDGMTVKIGDTIEYTITITKYKAYGNVTKSYPAPANNSNTETESAGTITFTDDKLIDELTGSSFSQTYTALESTGSSDVTYTYTTSLKLTKENFGSVVKNSTITNTAEFSYTYSSSHSSGSLTSNASAAANVTVEIPQYVVDFGLPVEINLSGSTSGVGSITACENGTYGTAEVNKDGTGFIYTPNKILHGVDHVTFTYQLTGDSTEYKYTVAIYPATTVYYEEGFATYTGSWTSTGSKGSGTQTAQVAGSNSGNYGYDGKYAVESAGPSNGTQATSTTVGDTATFTFTGTGFELYANCTTTSGYITVIVMKKYDNTYTPVKAYIVNTVAADGKTSATDGQAINLYSLPVISEQGLEHGTYTVTITHSVNESPIYIDGIRIYGTLKEEPEFYKTDSEDNPTFIELRDQVLAAQGVTSSSSGKYADQIAADIYSQVYASGNTNGAVIIDNSVYSTDQLQDLLDNGPKNEIFLRHGQSLVFKVVTNRKVEIGLKAPNAATVYSIQVDDGEQKSYNISTSTDMFYTVLAKNAGDSTNGTTITITNTGDGILSITKLKICDDPNATLGTLTEEDLIPAMVSLGFELDPSSVTPEEPEEPVVSYADAKYTITLVDKKGKPVGVVELTANGVEGETKTFTAREILAAVMSQMPKGYVLENISAISDVEVVYGQSAASSFRVFNVGSLVNSLIKGIFQKKGPIMKP